jgi:hypothetical protein
MKYRTPHLIATLLLLTSCGQESRGGGYSRSEAAPEMPVTTDQASPAPAGAIATQNPAAPTAEAALKGAMDTTAAAGTPTGTGTTVVPSMLIRTGEAQLEVDDLEPAISQVRALATRLGGYVGNTSLSGGRQQARTATLELKLPADRFDQALNGLKPIGRVESVSATAQDVGEEYVDIQARRTNSARLEQRLLELLANRTGRLEDVLTVERELARVREEIERYDGRLRYLRTRAAVSTLTVNLHEPIPLLDDGPGANPIVRAVRRSWQNFVGFVAGFIELLGVLIPLTALLVAAVWVIRRYVWRRKPPTD